jgi:hypothetical protein
VVYEMSGSADQHCGSFTAVNYGLRASIARAAIGVRYRAAQVWLGGDEDQSAQPGRQNHAW